MKITSLLLSVLAFTILSLGCDPKTASTPPVPRYEVFFGNVFARGTGKTANLKYSIRLPDGETATLPATLSMAASVTNAEDNCSESNLGWNSSTIVSATSNGYALTGQNIEKNDCKYSSDLHTFLTINLAIDSTTNNDMATIAGAFPPGTGAATDIVVADLEIIGTEPTVTITGVLLMNDGDAVVEITVDAAGVVEGYVGIPGNAVDINGVIQLASLGQIPAQTIAASLLANAITMARY